MIYCIVFFLFYMMHDCGIIVNSYPFFSATKFLGIFINNYLSWSPHINVICHKISKGVGILYRTRDFLPKYALPSIYKAIIIPYLSYGTLLWRFLFLLMGVNYTLCKNGLYALFVMHHLMLILTSCSLILNILTVFDIYRYQIAAFIYGYINGLLPSNFHNFLEDHTCRLNNILSKEALLPLYPSFIDWWIASVLLNILIQKSGMTSVLQLEVGPPLIVLKVTWNVSSLLIMSCKINLFCSVLLSFLFFFLSFVSNGSYFMLSCPLHKN